MTTDVHRTVLYTTPAQAFPSQEANNWDRGMALRDYFAAKMMPAISTGVPSIEQAEVIAETAYMVADAMLKARDE